MSSPFVVQNCAIAIAAADLNPAMLNVDILRYSGVIPADWEVTKTPIYHPRMAQIVFKNGINIIAEGKQVIIAQPLEGDLRLQAPAIAQQYIRAFPKLQYKGFATNVRGYLLTDYPAGRYVCDTWLAHGPWQDDCTRAALNLMYQGDRAPLQLALTEAMLETKQGEKLAIVLFNGRYSYAAKGDTSEAICSHLASCFDQVPADIAHYTHLITTKFIEAGSKLTPEAQPQLALSAVG